MKKTYEIGVVQQKISIFAHTTNTSYDQKTHDFR